MMASLVTRLDRLERRHRSDGRCPACRGRPVAVVVAQGDAESEAQLAPCPACGWVPLHVVLLEVEAP